MGVREERGEPRYGDIMFEQVEFRDFIPCLGLGRELMHPKPKYVSHYPENRDS